MTVTNPVERFTRILQEFHLKGKYSDYTIVKTGNINDTYLVSTDFFGTVKQYIVQRVNNKVFLSPEQVTENAALVTEHIEKKLRERNDDDMRRKVVRYYRRNDGSYYYIDESGDYWRVMSYVFNSVSYNQVDKKVFFNTGKAFGQFQHELVDFPAEKLYVTIKDFHNTPKRFCDLKAAVQADVCGRVKEVAAELEYLFSREKYISIFSNLHACGDLPYRVVHNDTKCNNVMFDSLTKEPLAVIDLDTVMPGFVAHDFGDAVRFGANTADEDEEDISKVSLDLDMFDAFAAGFIAPLRGILTDAEYISMPDGLPVITLELAARFLTDYLNGDTYFKVHREKHNLIRARCQIALARDIEHKMPLLRDRLERVYASD